MNKTELIAEIARAASVSGKDAGECLNAFIACVGKTLKKGGEVRIPGFGTFAVAKRAARTGRNPRTGEQIKIKASKAPKFRAGQGLKDAVK